MDLREGEEILKIYHHHYTPFIWQMVKAIVGFFPFFFLIWLFKDGMSTKAYVLSLLVVFTMFVLIVIYLSLIYWLDKLVITNKRVVHIDWKYLTVRDEAEALLKDIQDVQTAEHGFLASIKFFDYGTLRMDTPSSYITIEFYNAPDPEGIRQYVFHVKQQ